MGMRLWLIISAIVALNLGFFLKIAFAMAKIFGFCLLAFFFVILSLWLYDGLTSKTQPDHGRAFHPDHRRASQPESPKPIQLKLLIDTKRDRVVYAECDKDFVDVLFSFLMLPMGKIIRLSNNESGIGSMDELYKSVEALNSNYFHTKACKNMLVEPRRGSRFQFDNLAVKLDEMDYTRVYVCSPTPCYDYMCFGHVSLVRDSICGCGKAMNTILPMPLSNLGGFVNREMRFMVTDDLQVAPARLDLVQSVLIGQGIKDRKGVPEKTVNIGVEEVLKLLHRSLLSKTPLSDVFLPGTGNINSIPPLDSILGNYQTRIDHIENRRSHYMEISAKLWFSESTETVVCVEAKDDFVDFIFSFLTMTLASVIETLKGTSRLGSIDKLYRSAHYLSSKNVVCSESMEMILSPKMERMFVCSNNFLGLEEEAEPTGILHFRKADTLCSYCVFLNAQYIGKCSYCGRPSHLTLKIINPKRPDFLFKTTPGGGFVKGQGGLLITDSLGVEPLSPISAIGRLDFPFSDMKHIQVIFGKQEAIALLKAALTSKTALTQAFRSQVVNRNKSSLP